MFLAILKYLFPPNPLYLQRIAALCVDTVLYVCAFLYEACWLCFMIIV